MDYFGLDDDERVIAETAAAFAEKRLAPYALEWDQNHHFPTDVLREAAELGMAAIYCRDDVGGSELRRLDAVRIFEELGYHVWFRYEKYREEYSHEDVTVAIDETPVGVFVEIEGGDRGIAAAARALGRSPADYVLDSYRGLFVRRCEELGVTPTDMLFEAD